ncbi:nuclease-related domain-containing protein [Neobacillus niacini]|uniref:nuclease-related domain-containing protein n=1 Tax=Neobacillus niacini TaxID=86668 RepID=UPI00286717B8|nr:nuclease-related domain-containing protein [Neobacillus niacini]MDR7000684.1 hypothetical protein [Neobacillus niacini]
MDLIKFEILDFRMDLTIDQKRYFGGLEKGFEGEIQFDLMTEQLQSGPLILNDLLLESNNTKFQIDSNIIFQDTYNFFEVKNYEGDYIYDLENFRTASGLTIQNPLNQLKRSRTLLRQLFQSLGYQFPIEAYVVFINPEFTLFNAPSDLPFIYPTQLNRFLKKLDSKPNKLTSKHSNLANKLVSLHQSDTSLIKLPKFELGQLKKGLTCGTCHSFFISFRGNFIICNVCGCVEKVEAAVMRNVREYLLLSPDGRITTNGISDWCNMNDSRKRINRILDRNFNKVGVRKGVYFE